MKRKFLVLGLVALLASCTAPAASGPASIEGKGAPSADIGTVGAVYTDTISGVSYRKTILGWVVIDQAVVGTSESGQEPASSQSSQSSAASSQSGQTSNPSSGSASSSQVGQTSNPSGSTSTPGSSSSSATSYSPFTPGTYDWNVDTTLYGRNFMVALAAKVNATRTATATYSSCLSIGARAAAYPNENSNTFIPFYHECKDSEKTTTSGCNREHTWPNSRGGGDKAGGTNIERDPIMVRPTIEKDNSNRGNDVYGDVNGSWDPASIGYAGARGESARVIFYVMCCYGESNNLVLNNSTSYSSGTRNMGILKTLLKWHHDYPPTDWERTVCERYAKMGHARNAFVTNPEFADYIWDSNGFRTTPYNLA
ncbi:MAG: endonuclease [Bacilli bacterium]|nr:endonuclease [Bacilli bacterium]